MRSVILRPVFLKRFVIKVVFLPMYVKGTHFCVVVSVFLVWSHGRLSWGGGIVCVDRESIVQHDIMDSVKFCSLYSSFCRW